MPATVSTASRPKRNGKLAVSNRTTLVIAAVIVFLVVVFDQVTKFWAVDALTGQPSIKVLGDFLMFTLVYNYGGALGTQLGSPLYYLVVALLIFPFILYYIWHYRSAPVLAYPLAFIAGGAVGNVIDRVRLGKVVDFIDVDFFDINLFGYQLDRWWTFNIADSAIFCAIIFLLVHLTFFHHAPKPAPPDLGEQPGQDEGPIERI